MNKIRYFSVLAVLIFLLSGVSGARAASGAQPVADRADLLTAREEEKLGERLQEVTRTYDCDVAVVTTESTGGLSPMEYADRYYETNGYGIGPDRDGLLLLVSMEERDWWITTWGRAIAIFTDYGISAIGGEITEKLGDADYYGAFMDFADLTEAYIREAENGTPYDVSNPYKKPMSLGLRFVIAVVAGLVAAAAALAIFFAQLRSVSHEREAREYVREGSFRLTRARDIYLYRTVMRTKIEREPVHTGGGGGGGSHTHTTSGGGNAGGGGGKF